MQLEKINGNTYYINNATNIGVYIFKNKNCLLVDTGINNGQARKIDEVLKSDNLHVKYIINTHSHIDHCGGNIYFQETYPGCLVYASKTGKIYIENPDLRETILFSSNPIKDLEPKNKNFTVNDILNNGVNKINDEKFDIISINGHWIDQIAIITPDRVCFTGDSVFSESIINKYSLPYLFDIQKSLNTLDYLKEIDADFFVPSHIEKPQNKDEFIELINKNIENIENYIEQILELLEQPLTREELLENLIILNELSLNFTQYYIYLSSVSAFLAYLRDKNFIDYSLENGRLYYYKK